jgi:DNA-binding response OmpR family regulator
MAGVNGAVTVLVVEDDPSSRSAMVALLSHVGFVAEPAGSVGEAMSMLERRRPRVLILDLMLPDGNGASVLAHVRQNQWPVHVAVWSGAANWKSMIDEALVEPDKVFVKPVDFKDLVKWINCVCGRAN